MKTLRRILLASANALHIPLPDESVQTIVTSPPYWGLRKYDGPQDFEWPTVEYSPMPGLPTLFIPEWCGSFGLEPTPEMYIGHLVLIWRELWRVLRKGGVCWLNLGDSYAGSLKGTAPSGNYYGGPKQRTNAGSLGLPPQKAQDIGLKRKDLIGIPWRAAFALQADGWWLRRDVIWWKENSMPESVTDRPSSAHEYLFLLAKSEMYFYDNEAIKEPLKETSLQRLTRAIGEDRKDTGGYPGQLPHTMLRPRPNINEGPASLVFGGNKADGYGTRQYSGNEWQADPARGANKRSVWRIPTKGYAGAHYAVFPTDLVEPCILAGTSEKGACAKCGAPRERIIDKKSKSKSVEERKGRVGHNGQPPQQSGWFWESPEVKGETWQPTCKCDTDEVRPCRVLDPFSGSGTTVMEANRLGRVGVGLDISHEYLRDQARERTGVAALEQFYNERGIVADDEPLDELPLFGR